MSEEREPDTTWLEALTEPQWRSYISRELRGIHDQTRKTNGRVTRLEQFRYTAIGGLAVVTAIVVPIFLKLVVG